MEKKDKDRMIDLIDKAIKTNEDIIKTAEKSLANLKIERDKLTGQTKLRM